MICRGAPAAMTVTADAPSGTAAGRSQRFPRRALLVLGHAEAELAGVPEGRAVDSARAHVEQVDEAEPDRAPDDRGRPIAVAERVERAVHPERAACIAVDHDEDGAAAGARGWRRAG